MRRRKQPEPEPPRNVWARLADGRIIPLDGVYVGVEDGMHVWQYRLPEPPVEMGADMIPAKTTLSFGVARP